jgi:hypothetical protein
VGGVVPRLVVVEAAVVVVTGCVVVVVAMVVVGVGVVDVVAGNVVVAVGRVEVGADGVVVDVATVVGVGRVVGGCPVDTTVDVEVESLTPGDAPSVVGGGRVAMRPHVVVVTGANGPGIDVVDDAAKAMPATSAATVPSEELIA